MLQALDTWFKGFSGWGAAQRTSSAAHEPAASAPHEAAATRPAPDPASSPEEASAHQALQDGAKAGGAAGDGSKEGRQ